jgi:hypothetical protein
MVSRHITNPGELGAIQQSTKAKYVWCGNATVIFQSDARPAAPANVRVNTTLSQEQSVRGTVAPQPHGRCLLVPHLRVRPARFRVRDHVLLALV